MIVKFYDLEDRSEIGEFKFDSIPAKGDVIYQVGSEVSFRVVQRRWKVTDKNHVVVPELIVMVVNPKDIIRDGDL